MILEFVDKTRINVEVIYGYPMIVDGKERDTLTIEIDPSKHTHSQILDIIRTDNNLLRLASYDTDENSNRFIIGDGYRNIYKFEIVRREKKKDANLQGKILPKEYEDVLVLMLNQMTYDEWEELMNTLEHSPIPEEVQLWESLQE